jgi:RNA polymerase sigma-70 factor (sigma-E family)
MLVTMGTSIGVSRSVSRDEAVAALFASQYRRLLSLATIVLGDRAAAEDAVQEAFIKLHRSWDRIRDLDAAPAYMRSIVMNTSRSGLRKLRVASRYAAPPGVDAASAEEKTVLREDQQEVLDAIRALPRRQRECITLRYYLDLSEKEIAQTLGISQGSVKSNTSRGMTALAAALEVSQ